MFNLVQKRRWYFIASGILLLACVGVMIYSSITRGAPFQLSIDFVGGSIYELRFTSEGATETGIRQVFSRYGEDNIIIQRLGEEIEYRWLIKGDFPDEVPVQAVFNSLETQVPFTREYLDGERYRLSYTRPEVTKEVLESSFAQENISIAGIEALTPAHWLIRGDLVDSARVQSVLGELNQIGRVELVPQSGSAFVLHFTETTIPGEFRGIFIENGDSEPNISRLGTPDENRWLVYSIIQDEATLATIFTALAQVSPLQDDSRFVIMGQNRYELRFTLPRIDDATLEGIVSAPNYANLYIERIGAGNDLTWLLWGKFADDAQRERLFNQLAFAPLESVQIPLDAYLLTSKQNIFTPDDLLEAFTQAGFSSVSVERAGGDVEFRWSIRGAFGSQEVTRNILTDLGNLAALDLNSARSRTVSETVGQEVTQSAIWAILFAALVITGFIAMAFRQIPKALRYGVCAVLAMVHDALVVMGFTSLMGLLMGWQIDALFLTAILTVVGFSVQDTIVMFDRIRENIPKHLGEPYEAIVNRSLLETVHRSLATQLSTFFIIGAILLFGGETIKQFIAILFVGLLSGMYSSIFIAVPLLVAWEKGEIPFLKGGQETVPAKRS